jgi:predicted phosphodiesterase
VKRVGLRRIGMVGDIHCEHVALETALCHLGGLGVDGIVAVGDIVDGDGDPNRCCELLEQHDVLTVVGNHERWMFTEQMRGLPESTRLSELSDDSARFLRGLPKTRQLETPAGAVLLCHGLGDNDMACLKPDDREYDLENNEALQSLLGEGRYAFVVNGHTHQRMVRRVGTLTVINAGTLHHGFDPCFGLVDFEREIAQFFYLDAGAVREAEARPLAEWTELF